MGIDNILDELAFCINQKETVEEKLNEIDSLWNTVQNELTDIRQEVLKNYSYCEKCKKFYRKNSFETINGRAEHSVMKNSVPTCSEDILNTEVREDSFQDIICPCGHVERTWL